MKKLLLGLITLVFFLPLWAPALSDEVSLAAKTSPGEKASFVEQMRPYAGELTPAQISDVLPRMLIGNTAVLDMTSKKGNSFKAYVYYPREGEREVYYDQARYSRYEYAGPWSVEQDDGYCHEVRSGERRCYPEIHVFIEDDKVQVRFDGPKKPGTYTLLQGKHDGSYDGS